MNVAIEIYVFATVFCPRLNSIKSRCSFFIYKNPVILAEPDIMRCANAILLQNL